MDSTETHRYPTLNRAALWCETPNVDISARTYKANLVYLSDGIKTIASNDVPVTRYVKSYERFKNRFSVFLFSDSDDVKGIESFMDSVAKKAKKEDVLDAVVKASQSSFKYIDSYYKGDK